MLPRARTNRMVAETLSDETLVCDLERNTLHSIRPLAAVVWRHCDGATGLSELAATARSLGVNADEQLVTLALDNLARAGLVTDWERPPAGVSRRTVLTGAALLVGVITMMAPDIAVGGS